jgi:predicted acetyltransferase
MISAIFASIGSTGGMTAIGLVRVAMSDGLRVRYDGSVSEPLRIIAPTHAELGQYAHALRRGWSPNNERPEAARLEQLAVIEADAAGFVARQVDREAKGPPITLPDGARAPRLPGYVLWMWDGEFCGSIGLRWQPGTCELPEHVLGHIGYAVVPWKRRRGYATAALAQMLGHARAEGLEYVHITTIPENIASQGVIERNGGVLVERFVRTPHYGGTPGLRYRIELAHVAARRDFYSA